MDAIAKADRALVQIVDQAMAEAARLAGPWLLCRPGCTQCCIGAFPITQLDARRLREGMTALDDTAAQRIRGRARKWLDEYASGFPGDTAAGILFVDEESEARFEDYANDAPCPALDPVTGRCDLYEARPIACRTFGPPARVGSEAIGVCELCFEGATLDEIAACEVEVDPENREGALLEELGAEGMTIVAFALK